MSKTHRHTNRKRSTNPSIGSMLFRDVDFSIGQTFYDVKVQLKQAKMELPDSIISGEIERLVFLGNLVPIAAIGGNTAWELAN